MPGRGYFKDLKNHKIIFAILFIGIISRLVFFVFFSPIPSSGNTGDSIHYYESALSLAEGKGYSFNGKPTAAFPPGYSLVLAGLFKLFFPSYKLAQFLNVILGTISCLLVFFICKNIFGERAAILSLGIMALSPTNIIWSAVILSENLFLPLLLGAILLWLPIIQDRRFSKEKLLKLILSGIALGMASLTRGQSILLPSVLFLWVLFKEKSIIPAFIPALIVSLSMLLAILPWTVRNKEALGSYELISTNGGINLLIGNHPGATGGYHDPEEGYYESYDEVEKNRLCMKRALSYIFSNPVNFIKLMPKKVFFLWCADSAFTFRYDLFAKLPQAIAYFFLGAAYTLYYLLFPAAAAGIIKFLSSLHSLFYKERGVGIVLLVLLFLYFSAFHAVFFAGARYNYPFYPFLIILASGSMDIWMKRKTLTDQP